MTAPRSPLLPPPSGFRPHISKQAKIDCLLIMLGLDPKAVDFHHEPPLMLRAWDPNAQDTIPPASDPRHLMPIAAALHAERTAKFDVPAIAKTKRLAKRQEEFRRFVLAKGTDDELLVTSRGARKRWPSRPFQKRMKRA